MRFMLVLLLTILTIPTAAHAQLPKDQLEPVCSRVDLRARSSEVGWPRSPHKGGRKSGLSLAVTEAMSLKLGKAITPLELDRALAKGERVDSAVGRLASIGACPLAEGPMDDVSFSRDPITIPPTGCERDPKRRLTKTRVSMVPVTDLDAAIGAGEPVVVQFKTDFDTIESIVVGRRYDPEAQRCEILVRGMAGPFCHAKPCEDGASWFASEKFKFEKAWVIR